jgi:hypothetical protein
MGWTVENDNEIERNHCLRCDNASNKGQNDLSDK